MKDDSLNDTQFTRDVLDIAQAEMDKAAREFHAPLAESVGKPISTTKMMEKALAEIAYKYDRDYTANAYREVWNEAIEAAAGAIDDRLLWSKEQIRKLKK